MTANETTYIIYDGDCPFCTAFVKMARLREAVGPVELLNAREPHPVVDEVLASGLDIDEGMAMKRGETVWHGDDVVHQIALLTSPVGPFNRLNAWIFKDPDRARVLYPWMVRGRNLALTLLGRRKITGEAKPSSEAATPPA